MSDWKPGQRFKLEVEGEFRHSELSGQNTNWTFFDLPDVWAKDGNTFVAYKEWFDTHATQIQRPLKFGDWVEVINSMSVSRGHKGVVVNPQAALGTGADVWLEGRDCQQWFGNAELRLIEPAKDK